MVDVERWALSAEVGDKVVYAHRNCFDVEHYFYQQALGAAMRAHLAGLVFLCQRRKGDGFDYEAQRISRPTAMTLRLVDREGRPLVDPGPWCVRDKSDRSISKPGAVA